jgi:hypothetical protein
MQNQKNLQMDCAVNGIVHHMAQCWNEHAAAPQNVVLTSAAN